MLNLLGLVSPGIYSLKNPNLQIPKSALFFFKLTEPFLVAPMV